MKSADEVIRMLVSERRFFVTLFHHFVHRYWTLKTQSRVDKSDEEILGTIEKHQHIKITLDTLFENINIFPSIFLDEALDALEKGDPSHLSVFFYFFPECIAPIQEVLEDLFYLSNRMSWEKEFSNQFPSLTPLQNQSYLFQERPNQQLDHPLFSHIIKNYQTALQRSMTLYKIIYSNSEDRVNILNMLNKKRESVSALEVNFGSLVNAHPAFDNFPELTREVENLVLFYFFTIFNLVDNEGNTFLHTAVKLKNLELIEIFLKNLSNTIYRIRKNNKEETFVDLLFDIGYFDSSFEEGEPLQTLEKFYILFDFLSADRQKNFSNLLFKTGEDFKTFMQITSLRDNSFFEDKERIIKILETLLKYYETLTTTDDRSSENAKKKCIALCKEIKNQKKYLVVLQLLEKHFPEECHDLKKTAIWASRSRARTSEITKGLIRLGLSNQRQPTTYLEIEDSHDNHNYTLGCQIQRPGTPPPSLPSPTY